MASILNKQPADWEHLLEQMIEATHEAIDEALSHKKRHKVIKGQMESAYAGGSHYGFQIQDDWEPGANTCVQVELDSTDPNQCMAGTILSGHNAHITLATEFPLPEELLTKATLIEADGWWLQRLQDALLHLQTQGENPTYMGARTFGLIPCVAGRGIRQLQMATWVLDDEQAEAIERGMVSQRLLVMGPPGTGKTSVACVLALEHLLANKTVLLVSQTNVALDSTMRCLQQFADQSGHAALVEEHKIVRCGMSSRLVGKAYKQMVLQRIVDQQLGKLTEERDRLQQAYRHEQEQIVAFFQVLTTHKEDWTKERSRVHMHCEEVRRRCEKLEQQEQKRITTLTARLAVVEQEYTTKQDQQQRAAQQLAAIEQQLSEAILNRTRAEEHLQVAVNKRSKFQARSVIGRFLAEMGGTSWQLLLVEEQRCREVLIQAKLAVTALEQQHEVLSLELFSLDCNIDLLQEEIQRLRKEQQYIRASERQVEIFKTQIEHMEQTIEHGDGLVAEEEAERQRRQDRCHHLQMHLNEITNEEQSIKGRVIAKARVIGTTLTELITNPALRDRQVDAVLIDDASMASVVSLFLAATHAKAHVALFGDPLQLRPVAHLVEKQTRPVAEYWLETGIFSYLRVKLEDADKQEKPVVMLTHQSRMLSAIAAPDSQFIYQGCLKSRILLQHTPLPLAPHPEWPLMVIDTSDIDRGKAENELFVCRAQCPPRSSSKINRYHIDCVVQLVRLLAVQTKLQEAPRIGVITPYAGQKIGIQRALREQNLLQFVHVGTIHSMQCAEYPCVIFDTTEGYGIPIGQFTSNTWGRHGIPHDATRLLNVAHSRAQAKLIYLANVAYIYQDAYRQEHLLTKFVRTVEEQGRMDSSLLFAEKTSLSHPVSGSAS